MKKINLSTLAPNQVIYLDIKNLNSAELDTLKHWFTNNKSFEIEHSTMGWVLLEQWQKYRMSQAAMPEYSLIQVTVHSVDKSNARTLVELGLISAE